MVDHSNDDSEILAAFGRWCEMCRHRAAQEPKLDLAYMAGEIEEDEMESTSQTRWEAELALWKSILRMPIVGAVGLAVKAYLILHFDDSDYRTHDPAALTREGLSALGGEPIYADLARFIPNIPVLDEARPCPKGGDWLRLEYTVAG